ncbi:MAG TPA: hypothetical protein DEE98_08820 [Elusimicrobia bacterium]|nr:MAG: hypothetical protein A2204_00640 [Elusimicrobia bacterium RIFOXYA1_FULL_47_7]OGS10855.1 MAG: hypothetical protein A2386_03095 [Elusimicrobia bacterium RIFOXYB1_FULL_48_9]OGS15704.1 MAG: hypothetical protein A2251_08435 [Elusimicrobia bacterium RIFOXYA2_FULL_47_53]OGS27077.1 MAG: hypothetical protein A2339_01185 [Elusimicrobia bacterium RIFOXYB12_FULL_50_12]OGS31005.1 MAG: hypothetical protein A2323_06755 [Elusimicrobia bacterium RIFOXYB2_FULL_46_23]HBU70464.1 hypothetical protein [Elus
MDLLKMVKEAAAMKSKLSQMEKTLRDKIITVEHENVSVKMNAKADIIDFKLNPDALKQTQEKLEKNILAALQKAAKQSHEVMAEEAKKITGGMNIPGLM